MKSTTKIKMLTILAVSAFYSTTSFAQKNDTQSYDQRFKLGIGLSASGVFDDPYKFSVGADARLQYNLTKRYSLTFTSGFSDLAVNGENNDLGYVPVKLGFKAFIYENSFYVMGEAGDAFAVTNHYNKNSLLFAPSIGYATKYIDLSLRYEYFPDFPTDNNGSVSKGVSQLGLRIAYGFDL